MYLDVIKIGHPLARCDTHHAGQELVAMSRNSASARPVFTRLCKAVRTLAIGVELPWARVLILPTRTYACGGAAI
jgi:hypothetical protein